MILLYGKQNTISAYFYRLTQRIKVRIIKNNATLKNASKTANIASVATPVSRNRITWFALRYIVTANRNSRRGIETNESVTIISPRIFCVSSETVSLAPVHKLFSAAFIYF